MTLGTPTVLAPELGLILPEWMKFQAQNPVTMARTLGYPECSIDVTTTTSDTGSVLDLTEQLATLGIGMTTGFYYPITLQHSFQTENDQYFPELHYMIRASSVAGTDPVIIGDSAMTTGVQGKLGRAFGLLAGVAQGYGRISLNAAGAGNTATEAVDGTNSHGVALADWSTSGALTFPLCRTARVVGFHYAEDAGTIGDLRLMQVRALAAAGTATLDVATLGGTEALTAPNGTNQYSVTLDAYPPANAFLVMDGTPDPGHIDVHVLGIASDEVRHQIGVVVGFPIPIPFFGS